MKPLTAFYPHYNSVDGKSWWCKGCYRQHRLDLMKCVEGRTSTNLLTSEELRERLVAQDGRCAICQTDITGSTKRKRNANIDHCHTTGNVRQLLCQRCNITVGYIEKSPVPFSKYFEYINKHREVNHAPVEEDSNE